MKRKSIKLTLEDTWLSDTTNYLYLLADYYLRYGQTVEAKKVYKLIRFLEKTN